MSAVSSSLKYREILGRFAVNMNIKMFIPLAYLLKASPTDIRQVVVCVCVCVRFHTEAPNLRDGFRK